MHIGVYFNFCISNSIHQLPLLSCISKLININMI